MAMAPIRHLTWELPYAAGGALKSPKKKKSDADGGGVRAACRD